MKVIRSTDAAAEIVTQANILNYLDYTAANATEITEINNMVKAARHLIEARYSVALAQQTLICMIEPDDIYNDRFTLPRFPHKTYVSGEFLVYAIDYQDTETALVKDTGYHLTGGGVDEYTIEFAAHVATVSLASDYNSYRVQYIAGYGITNYTETVPEVFPLAIKKLVSEWYQKRENYIPVITSEVNKMLMPYSHNAGF